MSTLHSRIAALISGPMKGQGWCSIEKANDLALAVIKLRATVSVELGVFFGRSVLPIAMAHAEQDHGIVWAIDPWSKEAGAEGYDGKNAEWWGSLEYEPIYETFIAHIKRENLERYVKVIRAKSDDVEPPDEIGLLHLDGQHTDQTIRDVERFAAKVVPGGFVFADDIHWSGGGVERGVEKLLTMGFKQIFVRDTGAMFQRVEIKKKAAKEKSERKPKKKRRKKRKQKLSPPAQ